MKWRRWKFLLDNHLHIHSNHAGKINDKYPLNKEHESSSSPSIVPMDGVNPDLISAIKQSKQDNKLPKTIQIDFRSI